MFDYFDKLYQSTDFMPHGDCLVWDTTLIWEHVGSDIVTGISYYFIAAVLFFFIIKRRDIPFFWIFLLFGAFILSCGTTHLMDAWTIYYPSYWTAGIFKTINAVISFCTAIILVPLTPKLLALPSLQNTLDNIAQLNKKLNHQVAGLEEEVQKRESVEMTLRQSESKYNKMVANLGDVIVIIDQDGINRYKSPNIEKWFGWKPEDVVGFPALDNVHPEDKEAAHEFLAALMEKPHAVGTTQCRYRCKDNTYRWIEFAGINLLHDQDILGLLGNYHDITERMQTELKILEEKEKAQKYLDVAGFMFCSLDTKGNITLINSKGCEILKVPENEAIGKNWFDHFLPERVVDKAKEVFAQLMAGEIKPVEFHENPIRTSDDQERIISFYNSILTDDENKIIGILFSGEDITKRKQLKNDLLRAKMEWEEAFDTINDSITMHDKDFNIVRCNKAAEGLLGLPLQNILKQKCYTSYHGTGCPPGGYPSCQCLKTGEPSVTEIFEPHLGKYIEIKALPRFNDQHEIAGLVHIVRDISARKKADEERAELETHLQQAYKMEAIGTMAGGIAHDFNNILAIILSGAEMVQDDLEEGSTPRHYIGHVISAARRATDLVKQILVFSRQGKQEFIPVQPQFIVKEYLKLIRSTIPTTVKIRQNIKDCGYIDANPAQIQQVIMNLCVNAMHAMNEEGILNVNMEQVSLSAPDLELFPQVKPGPFVKLSVTDTGTGMNKETMARIFEPFFTTKEVGEGTGMGLAVVHGIVTNHGGMITVDSEPGKGTTFEVYFPTTESEVVVKEAENAEPLPRGTERILFVDDEELLAETGSMMLERYGYEVTSKISSTEALALFHGDPDFFDLIITDQTMPNLSGIKFAVEVLKVRPDLPIILCTGYSKTISEEKVLEIGIKELCLKPLEKEKLVRTVRRLLDENKS